MSTRSSAFTLIELLVVVAVIGILSTIGLVQYQGYVAGTKLKSAKNAMQQIHKNSKYLADPHGAVGYLGAKLFQKKK